MVASQGAGTDPALFAGGISRALIPVTMGIVVALPALAVNGYFRNWLRNYATDVEISVKRLLEIYGEMERSGISPERAGSSC